MLPALRRTGRRRAEHRPARRWEGWPLYSGCQRPRRLVGPAVGDAQPSPLAAVGALLDSDPGSRCSRSARSHAARGGRRPPEPALPLRHGDRAIRHADVWRPGRFDGDFRYVSAGHPGPIYLPAGGPPVILQSPGFPIGLADEAYEREVMSNCGGRPVVSLLRRPPRCDEPDGERFGDARLLDAIGRGRIEPLREGDCPAADEIARWQGGARPQDDISVLAVELSAASDRPE